MIQLSLFASRLIALSKKVILCFLLSASICICYGQIPSTDGTYTATGATNPNLTLRVATGATINTRLTILNSSGFVGINNSAPSDWLHVSGNVRANQFNITTGVLNTIGASTNMSFNINSTNRMTLLSGGNLGVGTATPARLLTVMAPAPVINIQTSGTNDANVRMLRFANSTDGALGSLELYGGSGEFRIFSATTYFLTFFSNGVEAMRITTAGSVGIGTTLANNPNLYKLAVNGKVGAKEFQAETNSTTWPDYVFAKDYRLLSLQEVKQYIEANQHLPEVPSASELEKNGHKLAEMDATLLKKVEELTLYILQLENRIEELENKK
jgi:hypothetical protein